MTNAEVRDLSVEEHYINPNPLPIVDGKEINFVLSRCKISEDEDWIVYRYVLQEKDGNTYVIRENYAKINPATGIPNHLSKQRIRIFPKEEK